MPIRLYLSIISISILVALAPGPSASAEVDWSAISPTDVLLIYPGVTSWEFLTSEDHRLGGKSIKRMRKNCRHCHLSKEGELDLKADEIASGSIKMKRSHRPFEPEPLRGRLGTMMTRIQAAYDDEFLYVRVEWPSAGAGWRAAPGARAVPDRVSIQMNKDSEAFSRYGCFITCHNDLTGMPGGPSSKAVRSEPYYGSRGRDDVRLYAYYARDGWKREKDPAELEKVRREEGVIDLITLEIESGSSEPGDGWIFDDRVWEKDSGLEAEASWTPNRYTAVFKKRLRGNGRRGVDLTDGDVVSIGIAIHDGGVSKRKHYVSFPFTIGLGKEADIPASRL